MAARVSAVVEAVCVSGEHAFSKEPVQTATVLEGLGLQGDAHAGVTVQHLFRMAKDPTTPNLRQVHLMHAELHDELRGAGHPVQAGSLGENLTTRGIALLELPTGARLRVGSSVVLEVTGLRNPCWQIDEFSPGLLKLVLGKEPDGTVVRRTGVMAVVLEGGEVRPGDAIEVELPDGPRAPLQPV
ncbi:MOSC domain-containing protein [Oryzihumus leptocrescens]|uniref:MOSC domain-containing protein n=1 Tax=Oryzihumus leptocrescens TaxID=297536 RepID=UPI001FEC108E|nr:MOSC domain-containing protein [Oryzihumus leptocrescens]